MEYTLGRIEFSRPLNSGTYYLTRQPRSTPQRPPPLDAREPSRLEVLVERLALLFPEYVAVGLESPAPMGYRRIAPGHFRRWGVPR
jgi:hypothetical protein